MSAVIVEELQKDVAEFDSKVATLNQRKAELTKEINHVESELSGIKPLYDYTKSLLARVEEKQPASRTAAATEARKRKAQERRESQSPN